MAGPLPDPLRVSIIIPVLNEADILGNSLEELFTRPWLAAAAEVIVCDGGSDDSTLEVVRAYPCRLIRSESGRGVQMNRASQAARGEYLLFLHADSRLPDAFDGDFPASGDWGFFRLRLDAAGLAYRIIETAINLRTRLTRVAGGDQGLYFRREFFNALQGYPAIPLMEDIAICKRARRKAEPVILDAALTSSSRRWLDNGVVKTVLLMWWLRFAYWLGVDPRRLHRLYYPRG